MSFHSNVTGLFKPDDYLDCEDAKVREIYQALKGQKPKSKLTDISNYCLSPNGYLLHLDRVTNRI